MRVDTHTHTYTRSHKSSDKTQLAIITRVYAHNYVTRVDEICEIANERRLHMLIRQTLRLFPKARPKSVERDRWGKRKLREREVMENESITRITVIERLYVCCRAESEVNIEQI